MTRKTSPLADPVEGRGLSSTPAASATDALSIEAFYSARPLRNPALRVLPSGEGLLVEQSATPNLSHHLRLLRALVAPRRRVFLDALGREIFLACDGQTPVWDIIARFADRHHLTFLESRVLVAGFLKRLVERGLVGLLTEVGP